MSITAATLKNMSREVAADSLLFGERLAPLDNQDQKGFSDLFMTACGNTPVSDNYKFAIEYIFEGYLLHYGRSRLLITDTTDFNLLAGDYMFARGLSYIAALKDLFTVSVLADLISLCSYIHCLDHGQEIAPGIWGATTLCIAGRLVHGESHLRYCMGAFAEFKGETWSGKLKPSRLNGIVENLLAGYSQDKANEIKLLLAEIKAAYS